MRIRKHRRIRKHLRIRKLHGAHEPEVWVLAERLAAAQLFIESLHEVAVDFAIEPVAELVHHQHIDDWVHRADRLQVAIPSSIGALHEARRSFVELFAKSTIVLSARGSSVRLRPFTLMESITHDDPLPVVLIFYIRMFEQSFFTAEVNIFILHLLGIRATRIFLRAIARRLDDGYAYHRISP